MIVQRQPDEITDWYLVFFTKGAGLNNYVPGRFKHVGAFGYSHVCRTWVVFDVRWDGTCMLVLPDGNDSIWRIMNWVGDSSILSVKKKAQSRVPFKGYWCVPAMQHLTGWGRGAVLPTGFYRSCLNEGAVIVTDGPQFKLSAVHPTAA